MHGRKNVKLPPPFAINKESQGTSVTSVLCYQYTRPHTPNNNNSYLKQLVKDEWVEFRRKQP